MSDELTKLSLRAHDRAMQQDQLTPAERSEWSHLRMKRVDGVPVFDAARMRAEDIVEVTEALERYVGRARRGSVREEVEYHMMAYGRFGLRVQDVCEAVEADKKIVLKYLREMVEDGRVVVKEEKTRGKGSMRKRYVFTENALSFGYEQPIDADPDVRVKNDDWWAGDDPQVIDHGTAICGFRCACGYCRTALENALVGEAVSAARAAGGTGFAEGLEIRTRRRVAAEQEFARMIGAL